MRDNQFESISRLITFAVLVLVAIAAAGGLLWSGLYQDNPFVSAIWQGNDLVTLLVALPLLAYGLIGTLNGSRKANLIRLGMLDTLFYAYAFYLFSAAFNAFFLVYSLLVTFSLLGLILGLMDLDFTAVQDLFTDQTPVRWIGGFQIFVGLGLSVVYLLQIGAFIFSGEAPAIIAKTDHITHIIPALDMTFVIPWLLLGGILIWQRKAWGYVISSIMMVKGVVYMLTLAVAGASAALAGFPEAGAEIPLWGGLWIGFVVLSVWMLATTSKQELSDDSNESDEVVEI